MKQVNMLTKQEKVVLALVARGLRNSDIARELVITPKTVEAHLSRIFDKLDVSSRTQAALYAIRHNLLSSAENVG
jgi:two-component system, NarL family, response regulator DegU